MRVLASLSFLIILLSTPCLAQEFPVTSDSEEALEHYRQAVEQYGKSRVLDAYSSLDRAIQIDSDFVMAYAFKGLLELFYYDKTMNSSLVAVQLSDNSSDSEHTFASAVHAFSSEDIEQAMMKAWELQSQFPSYWLTTALLGNFHLFSGGSPSELEEILRIGLRYHSDHNALNNWLGYALRWQGKLEEAKEVFEKNIENYPDQPNPYDSMGNYYRFTGENEKAAEQYEMSIEVEPNFSFGNEFEPRRNKLGNIYLALGRFEDAEQILKENIGYNPNRPLSYQSLGELYLSLEKNGLAERQFKIALGLNPEFQPASQKLVNLAIIKKHNQLFIDMSHSKPKEIAQNLFTTDATIYTPDQDLNIGRSSIESTFSKMIDSGILVNAQTDKVEIFNEVAYEYGCAAIRNSEKESLKMVPYSVLWKKSNNGWQMHHYFISGAVSK